LKNHFTMSIATSSNSKPSSSIMLYAIDDDFTMYMATHIDSYKSKNLLENPNIGISIWEIQKMLVQIDAEVEKIEDSNVVAETLDKLADAASKDISFWPPVFRIEGGDYIVFKIKPYWIRALDLTQNTIRQEDSPFTIINLN
jgi:nitroimidazol reductase NimA-like FMN-containing flavoprotein (pyridoxamine 5'-phosphate oxidase superfamily)